MATASITKRTVDAAQPGARDQFIWDDSVAGFGLKVTPAGGKIYVFQYRLALAGLSAETAARRFTIGKHGALTPEQARKRAKELAAMVAAGTDPMDAAKQARASSEATKKAIIEQRRLDSELAFSKYADLWLDHYENEKQRSASSVRLAGSILRNHLKPHLQDKPMPHIGRADLQSIIDSIPTKNKGMRRSVFAYASILFGWAASRGDVPRNPLVDMAKPQAPKARDRVLNDHELANVWIATQLLGAPFGPFFRLLILTGQRRSEVAGINWAELDRSTALWTIPAARAKNGAVHLVPLSEEAVSELDALAGGSGWPKNEFVLTTTGRSPISGMTKAKNALDTLIGDAGDTMPAWRIHDLRRTLATGLQRLGVGFEVTEAVLNHISGAKGGVAGIYQRHDWKDEKRSALNAWARHVAEIVEPTRGDNVVPLHAIAE